MKYILLVAVTIDGKIARNKKHATSWTSKEDKDHMHKILDKCDLIIIGNNTFKTAKKPLSKRNCLVLTRSVKTTKVLNDNCTYLNPKSTNIKTLTKGHKNICILGGTETYSFALKNNMVDEIYMTIEPYIFGYGLNLFDTLTKKQQKLQLKSVKKLNNKGTLLLRYSK